MIRNQIKFHELKSIQIEIHNQYIAIRHRIRID